MTNVKNIPVKRISKPDGDSYSGVIAFIVKIGPDSAIAAQHELDMIASDMMEYLGDWFNIDEMSYTLHKRNVQ